MTASSLTRRARVLDQALLGCLLLALFGAAVGFGGKHTDVRTLCLLVIFLTGVAVLLARLVLHPRPGIYLPPGWVGGILVAGVVLESITRAPVARAAWLEAIYLLGAACLYGAVVELCAVRGRWRWVLSVFFLLLSILCWYAVIQHVRGSTAVLMVPRPAMYGMRATATFINPNHFGFLVAIGVIAATGIAACASAGWPLRIIAAYTVLLGAPTLLLTQSRGAWCAVTGGWIVLVLLLAARAGWRRLAVAAAVLPLAGALIAASLWLGSDVVRNRVHDTVKGDVRPALWHDTAAMIQHRPWLGHGAGSYRYILGQYQERYRSHTRYPLYAHSEILHYAAEYGIVGTAVFAGAYLWIVFGFGLRRVVRASRERDRVLAAILVAVMTTGLLHACVDFPFHIPACLLALVLLVGVFCGVLLQGDARPVGRVAAPLMRVLGVAGGVLLLTAAVAQVRALVSDEMVEASNRQRGNFNYDAARTWAHRAIAWSPGSGHAYGALGNVLKSQTVWRRDPDERRALAEEAVYTFWAALDRNPYDCASMLALSQLYGDILGDDEKSLDWISRMEGVMPRRSWPYTERGTRLRRMGRLEEALDAFDKAFKLSRHDRTAALNRAALREHFKEEKRRKRRNRKRAAKPAPAPSVSP